MPLYIHRTCKRVLGIELLSNRCFRHSFSSLPDTKHAPGSTIWCIVEPHHHAEGVLVLSPDIEVTSESAVPLPLSVASAGGCLPQAMGQLKVHCLV